MFGVVGLGLITGAADDDCSAIGTYASAGARFGPSFLWTAPVTFPMMFAVVYLSSKLGQVAGKGLFDVIREHYSKWILQCTLIGVLIGNTIEAGADIGAMAAAINIFLPVPIVWIVVPTTAAILCLQIWGSYTLIRNIFRWLALVLLAYIGSALLAKPDLGPVLRGTFIPTLQFTEEFLSILVAVIGYHAVGIPLYLAIKPGGGRGDRKGPHPPFATEGRDGRGTSAQPVGRALRDVLLERRDVFHHPVDRINVVQDGKERYPECGRSRRGFAPAGR